jgi:hypothetical protein
VKILMSNMVICFPIFSINKNGMVYFLGKAEILAFIASSKIPMDWTTVKTKVMNEKNKRTNCISREIIKHL